MSSDASKELLEVAKMLLERHQLDNPHHNDLCADCIRANAAIKQAEQA